MKRSFQALVATVALVSALVSTQLAIADTNPVEGQWKLTVQTPNGINHPVLTIRAAEGGAFSGTYAGPRGTFEIASIAVEGSTFSFPLTVEMPIGAVELKYRGTVTGDAIEGIVGNPRGEIPFTGERVKAE